MKKIRIVLFIVALATAVIAAAAETAKKKNSFEIDVTLPVDPDQQCVKVGTCTGIPFEVCVYSDNFTWLYEISFATGTCPFLAQGYFTPN